MNTVCTATLNRLRERFRHYIYEYRFYLWKRDLSLEFFKVPETVSNVDVVSLPQTEPSVSGQKVSADFTLTASENV